MCLHTPRVRWTTEARAEAKPKSGVRRGTGKGRLRLRKEIKLEEGADVLPDPSSKLNLDPRAHTFDVFI